MRTVVLLFSAPTSEIICILRSSRAAGLPAMFSEACFNFTEASNSASAPHPDLSVYCKDLDDWPRSWMAFEKDIPPGEKIVACFRPFLEHLIGLRFSRKTIRKHADNLWILGGELIRDLNDHPSLRKKNVEQVCLS